jgi:hypothetical protein
VTAPAPGPGDPACPHDHRDDLGVCTTCGHCSHSMVLNAACVYCGSTDLDPIAMSPKKLPAIIPVDRLRRR